LRWLKEPLLHFLLIGAGLFWLFYEVGDPAAERDDRIVVTADDVERLVALWGRTWQRPPTSEELQGLIDGHIREEVLFREAVALGLDEDDTIVRRRLAQKAEFLLEDLTAQPEPDDAELESYLQRSPDRFRTPARYTLAQVYLSPDRRGDEAEADALRLLETLRRDGAAVDPVAVGDPLMLERRLVDHSETEIAGLLGQDFAAALAEVPEGRWAGPLESAYGLHLVYVESREPARVPPLSEIRDRVLAEYVADRQREANESIYQALKARYEIVIEAGDGPGGADLSARLP
jgi:hypothetical protein